MKKFLKSLGDILDDVLAYILTVVGILFSNIIPLMKSNEAISLDIGAFRIIGAMIIAILFVSRQEALTPDQTGNTAKAREGRRNNFKQRMVNALSQGFMWSTLMNMAG